MRSIKVLLATTILVLALAGAANAGCMATVGLSSVPDRSRPRRDVGRRPQRPPARTGTALRRNAHGHPDRAGIRTGEGPSTPCRPVRGAATTPTSSSRAPVPGRSRSTTASPSRSARRRTPSARSASAPQHSRRRRPRPSPRRPSRRATRRRSPTGRSVSERPCSRSSPWRWSCYLGRARPRSQQAPLPGR